MEISFSGIANFIAISSRTCLAQRRYRFSRSEAAPRLSSDFISNVVTSDVLELDYLDLVFDCHEIDKLVRIEDNSLDVITLTNVLHHLKSPIDFLNAAAAKLKPGGKVIATEPYFRCCRASSSNICITSQLVSRFPSRSWTK